MSILLNERVPLIGYTRTILITVNKGGCVVSLSDEHSTFVSSTFTTTLDWAQMADVMHMATVFGMERVIVFGRLADMISSLSDNKDLYKDIL